MWWLNYSIKFAPGFFYYLWGQWNRWVLLVSGFVNKYTYFDVVRKYKLLVDERVLKKRGRREREQ